MCNKLLSVKVLGGGGLYIVMVRFFDYSSIFFGVNTVGTEYVLLKKF